MAPKRNVMIQSFVECHAVHTQCACGCAHLIFVRADDDGILKRRDGPRRLCFNMVFFPNPAALQQTTESLELNKASVVTLPMVHRATEINPKLAARHPPRVERRSQWWRHLKTWL